MTQEELIERVRAHEKMCRVNVNANFVVKAVVALAVGVLAVREVNGTHTIYFDLSQCRIREDSIFFPGDGRKIPNFPTDTGFVIGPWARDWNPIMVIAQRSLVPTDGGEINWHSSPCEVNY